MGKLTKILLSVLAAVALLLAAAALLLPQLIDPNRFKPAITAAVKQNIGRDLSIDGDLELTLFPWIGIATGRMRLSNASGFGEEPFAVIEHADVRVKLIPLLSKEVEVKNVILKGFLLNLRKDPSGTGNWEDLFRKPAAQTSPPTEDAGKPVEELVGPVLAALVVGGVSIENAKVSWDDRQSGQTLAIDAFNLKTDEFRVDAPLHLTLSFSAVGQNPKLRQQTSLEGRITVGAAFDRYRVEKLTLTTYTDSELLPAGPMAAEFSAASISLEPRRQAYAAQGLQLSADLQGHALAGAPIKTEVSVPALEFNSGDGRWKLEGIQATSRTRGDPNARGAVAADLSASGLSFDQTLETGALAHLRITTRATGASAYGGAIESELTAPEGAIDWNRRTLTLSGVQLGATAQGEVVRNGKLDARLTSPQVIVAEEGRRIRLGDVEVEARGENGVLGEGFMDVSLTSPEVGIGDLKSYYANAMKLSAHGDAKAVPSMLRKFDMAGTVNFELPEQRLQLKNLELATPLLRISGDLGGERLFAAPIFQGNVRLAPFDPRELMAALDVQVPPTRDPKALSAAQGGFRLKADANALDLTDLALKIDDTNLSGRVSVKGFVRHSTDFDLDADRIDAERYLPASGPNTDTRQAANKPAPTGKKVVATPSAIIVAAAGAVPLDLLRALDLRGRLRIADLQISGLRAQQVNLTVAVKEGQIRTRQSIGKLYDGSYEGSVKIDARPAEPLVSLQERVSDLSVAPFLTDLTGKAILSGTADADMNARGADAKTIEATLQGKVNAEITNGSYTGFDLLHSLRAIKSRIEGKPRPPGEKAKGTDFSKLTLKADVQNGIVGIEKLQAQSPLLQIDGTGTVSLADEQIDSRLVAKIVDSQAGRDAVDLRVIEGIPLPFEVRGTLSDPAIRFDLKTIVVESRKARIDGKKEELLQTLDKKLDKALGDKVDENFKKDLGEKARKFLEGIL